MLTQPSPDSRNETMAEIDRLPDSQDTGGTCPRCSVFANFHGEGIWLSVLQRNHLKLSESQLTAQAAKRRGGVSLGFVINDHLSRRLMAVERFLFFRCQRCNCGITVIERFDAETKQWKQVSHWPEVPVVTPDHLPPPIEELFREAVACLSVSAPRGAAIMARTTIEAVLGDRKAEGERTVDRIRSMAPQLPAALLSMMQELRLGGNDATHRFDHAWTMEEAELLIQFLRHLVYHLYEVPEQILEAQRATAKRRSKVRPMNAI